jgi:hypothetical protein
LAVQLLAEGLGSTSDWLLAFTIADPRVELLRRLCRLVFDLSGVYGNFEAQVSERWYELLLTNRFEALREQERPAHLRSAVAQVNGESLKVWEEMLAFARTGDVYSADEVNARAGKWVEYVTLAAHAAITDMKLSRAVKDSVGE